MGYGDYYPPYVSVAEKKRKAQKKLEKLKKQNPKIKPVILEDSKIARTWWGKSWNTNLERYADYSNRIGRGRSYVRHGAVLDLQIDSGVVTALVQGSESRPYKVKIKIKGIRKKIWGEIKKSCQGEFNSLSGLLEGKFPKALAEIFMAKGAGLFPSPKEIEFDCSCPDWAYMCKHVAAALFGIGSRLDEEPDLFFKLRNVNMDDLVSQAIEEKTDTLLKKATDKTSRVMDESDIQSVFGIDLEDGEGIENIKKGNKGTAIQKKPKQVRTVKQINRLIIRLNQKINKLQVELKANKENLRELKNQLKGKNKI